MSVNVAEGIAELCREAGIRSLADLSFDADQDYATHLISVRNDEYWAAALE
jgi:hypothetical protein